jgi:hypothetical protein
MRGVGWFRRLALAVAVTAICAVVLGPLTGCKKPGEAGSPGNEPPPAKQKMLGGTMKKGPDTSTGDSSSSKR